MKFVINALSVFLGRGTPERMRDLDATGDSWIDHHYTYGSSKLVITHHEVKREFKGFMHNLRN